MSVTVQCPDYPLSREEVNKLWQTTITMRSFPDQSVTVQCISPKQSQHFNATYRQKNSPTNVLTFSYSEPKADFPVVEPASHDVAMCLHVAKVEARSQGVAWRGYVAWLLVHAFLHITGLDHEESTEADAHTRQLEKKILTASRLRL